MSVIDICLNWNNDLDDSIDSEGYWVAEVESDIKQDKSIEDRQCPEHQDVTAAPTVPGMIRPVRN